jgi:bifunctional UDP-N-acetylglucosamine pyrophosphorylase/glucosamine-1-phosphate N-acetyltransferase
MSAPLHVVVLAAGEGKRMKSALPKVLQKIAGRPMLAHVHRCARALSPQGIHVVYGHGGEAVRAAFADQPDLHWASRRSSSAPGTPCSKRCPACPTMRACWCCTATCR